MDPKKILVLPRVYLGIVFLGPAYAKLFGPAFATIQIEKYVGRYGVNHAYEWYRGFLQGVVMQHVGLFGTLVTIGEWYVVFAMLFGITTRLAAGIAIFMLLNFLATDGLGNPLKSGNLTFIVLCLIVMIGSAGRTLGVDRFLHERYPRVPIW